MKSPDDHRSALALTSATMSNVIASVHRTCSRARLALLRGVDDPRFAQNFAAWLAACERAGARMATV